MIDNDRYIMIYLFHYYNSLRHFAGPLAFGLQAQSRGCVKLVGVKGGLRKRWFVKQLVGAKRGCVKAGWWKSWFA